MQCRERDCKPTARAAKPTQIRRGKSDASLFLLTALPLCLLLSLYPLSSAHSVSASANPPPLVPLQFSVQSSFVSSVRT